jgi:hypothetical protein
MCRTEWNDFKFKVLKSTIGTSIKTYKIEKVQGDWPSDHDLITLCDGGYPPFYYHFGGKVIKYDNDTKAVVDVHID